MTGLLRTALLLAWPHGGQRRARANALTGLRDVQRSVALQAEAARAFEPRRAGGRVAASR
jgi:hypothetical protein